MDLEIGFENLNLEIDILEMRLKRSVGRQECVGNKRKLEHYGVQIAR